MKKFLLLVSLLAAVFANRSWACSIFVNDLYQKNQLVSALANQLDIALTSVTQTTLTDYSRELQEDDPETLCAQFLETGARISFKYKPSARSTCDASAVITRREYIGENLDHNIPREEITLTDLTGACSTSMERLPIPLPRRCIPWINC